MACGGEKLKGRGEGDGDGFCKQLEQKQKMKTATALVRERGKERQIGDVDSPRSRQKKQNNGTFSQYKNNRCWHKFLSKINNLRFDSDADADADYACDSAAIYTQCCHCSRW